MMTTQGFEPSLMTYWKSKRIDEEVEVYLSKMNPENLLYRMAGPLQPDDPQLLQLVRERYLVPPSKEPYFLEMDQAGYDGSDYSIYRTHIFSWVFLNGVITTLFKDEPPGFFVEAGALDGEYLSNTLDLESKKNWKGLLVEADGETFNNLKKKHRKAWISHTCLAAFPFPHQTTLVKFTNHQTKDREFSLAVRGFNALMESKDLQQRMDQGFPVYETAQCLPLQTLLLAINVTHVNFISLDVEGVEMGVLKSFLGDKVTVDVWIVEHKHEDVVLGQNDELDYKFIYWFQSKGYTLYTFSFYSPMDYIFIRNGSDIYERAFAERPAKYNKVY